MTHELMDEILIILKLNRLSKEEMISVFVAHNKAMARLIGLLVFIGFVGALVYFNVFTHQLAHAQLQIRARPRRILMDTDVDMDDFFSLFYLLKENTSEFNLEVFSFTLFNYLPNSIINFCFKGCSFF